MAAYRRVNDCQEPGSAPEPYARYSSTGYLCLILYSHRRHRAAAGVRTVARSFRRKIDVSQTPAWPHRSTDRPTDAAARRDRGRETIASSLPPLLLRRRVRSPVSRITTSRYSRVVGHVTSHVSRAPTGPVVSISTRPNHCRYVGILRLGSRVHSRRTELD